MLRNDVDSLASHHLTSNAHQGPTTAAFLRERGHEVDLLTSQETIASFLGATTRPPLLTRLFKQGIQMFHHLKAERLEKNCSPVLIGGVPSS